MLNSLISFQLVEIAKNMAHKKDLAKPEPSRKTKVTRRWLDNFMKRNPGLPFQTSRTTKPAETPRFVPSKYV